VTDSDPFDSLPRECDGTAFPEEMNGFAFIAFHGSWNRDPPTGYKVVYVPMDDNGDAIGNPFDLLAHEGQDAKWEDGFRPVDVDFDDCGRFLLSSDGSNGHGKKLVRIDYGGPGVTSTCNRPLCKEGGGGSSAGSPFYKRCTSWVLIAALSFQYFSFYLCSQVLGLLKKREYSYGKENTGELVKCCRGYNGGMLWRLQWWNLYEVTK
jgi:hypothetical protein